MKAFRAIVALLAGLILLGATLASAQDWPQWRGPNRDGKVSGFKAPDAWPQELKQQWTAKVGEGDASPALVGDKVYVFARQGGDEVTQCLNAADGKPVWEHKDPAADLGRSPAAKEHTGPRSSPAVADGKVVTIGVHGQVTCLNAEDGKQAWRKDLYPDKVPQFFTSSSPMIAEGMAIAQVGNAEGGAVVALALADGAEKWKWDAEGADYSSPIMATIEGTKMVIALTAKSAVGLGLADGKLLWQVPFAPAGRMSYNAATPIVEGSTVILTGSGRGTKAVKIEKAGEAFKATDLWTNPDLAVQFNTPVLKDGFLYGLTAQGSLFCINAADGKTAWTDSAQRGPRGFAAIVDAGPVLMALPNTSEMVVYKPDSKAMAEVAKIKVAPTPTYATPVIAGDRILIKDKDSLVMYTLK